MKVSQNPGPTKPNQHVIRANLLYITLDISRSKPICAPCAIYSEESWQAVNPKLQSQLKEACVIQLKSSSNAVCILGSKLLVGPPPGMQLIFFGQLSKVDMRAPK